MRSSGVVRGCQACLRPKPCLAVTEASSTFVSSQLSLLDSSSTGFCCGCGCHMLVVIIADDVHAIALFAGLHEQLYLW